MSRWTTLGIALLTMTCLTHVSEVEARGRRGGYCANCQYSMPTVTLPAAQTPAAPAEAAAEEAATAAETEASVTDGGNAGTYYQTAGTRRFRRFGRFRN